jgi:hypothetical protein
VVVRNLVHAAAANTPHVVDASGCMPDAHHTVTPIKPTWRDVVATTEWNLSLQCGKKDQRNNVRKRRRGKTQ